MALTVAELRAVVSSDVTGFEAGMKRVHAAGAGMRSTGRKISKGLTLPIVGAGVAMFKVAGDFEKSMNRVSALSGATGKQLHGMREQAKQLGETTQYSASQAADAMGFLAMAGFDANEIMKAMPQTLSLAAAGQVELADAADIASNILTGFGLKATEMGRASDVLAKTFSSTNTDLNMLGESMKYVAPVASSAGLSFEETAAAVGRLGQAGIQGSMAGTSLRMAITKLLNPSKEGAKALERLGIEALDSEGNLKPLDEIVKELEDSGAKTGDMMKIFGQRAGPAMAALVSQGHGELTKLTTELKNSGGTADRMAKTQMKGLHGELLKLKSAAAGFLITLGESGALETMTELVEDMTGAVGKGSEAFADLTPEQQKWALGATLAAAAAGPLLWILGALVGAFARLATAIIATTKALYAATIATGRAVSTAYTLIAVKTLEIGSWLKSTAAIVAHKVALVATTIATKAIRAATIAWTAVQWGLNAALTANPIGIVIALIAALVVGVVLAYKKSDTFRSIVDGALRAVGKAGQWMWHNALKPVFRYLLAVFKDAWGDAQELAKFIGEAWDSIKKHVAAGALSVVDKVLWMAEKVLAGAVKAFGWAPEIGDKLKAAQGKVAEFRRDVNDELGRIKDEDVNVKVKAGVTGTAGSRYTVRVNHGGGSGRFASGGGVRGPGGPRTDEIPAWLSNGEWVNNAEVVRKAGGFAGMAALERAILSGEFARKGDLPRYAVGGPVFTGSVDKPDLTGPVVDLRKRFAADMAKNVGEQLVNAVGDMMKKLGGQGKLTPAGIARGQRFARSQVGDPYVWGGVGPNGYDCSGFVSAVLNAALGRNPHSRRGSTATMPWPGFKPGGGSFSIGWFTGNPGHMAATIGGLDVESAGGVGVRVGGSARGAKSPMFNGLAHYDTGGWLLPGTGPVNETGKPEAVLTPEESRAYKELARRLAADGVGQGLGGPQVHQDIHPAPTMDEKALGDAAADRLLAGLAVLGGD